MATTKPHPLIRNGSVFYNTTLRQWGRNCPCCGLPRYYSSQAYAVRAARKNKMCKQCARHDGRITPSPTNKVIPMPPHKHSNLALPSIDLTNASVSTFSITCLNCGNITERSILLNQEWIYSYFCADCQVGVRFILNVQSNNPKKSTITEIPLFALPQPEVPTTTTIQAATEKSSPQPIQPSPPPITLDILPQNTIPITVSPQLLLNPIPVLE